jgi:tight adherence protein C
MTSWWLGALLGAGAASGAIMAVRAAPPMRPIRLADRIAPYLGDTPAPSRLLASPSPEAASFAILREVFGPLIAGAVRGLDRFLGGTESVRRRLGGLGVSSDVEEFRVEQVLWGASGAVGGALLLTGLTAAQGHFEPILIAAATAVGGVAGLFSRDWWLSQQVRRRERSMLAEFPIVADLLALAVLAGEAPIDALQRVCRLTRGELTHDLRQATDAARAGVPMTRALSELAQRTTVESFARFLEGVVVAIERGTPLAEVLRAQAVDVREQSKRALLEAGGKKEVQMMVPVVFMILPVTVLFALYPGLLTLVSLSR